MAPLRLPPNPFDRWARSESGLHLPSRLVPRAAKRLHHIEKFGQAQCCCSLTCVNLNQPSSAYYYLQADVDGQTAGCANCATLDGTYVVAIGGSYGLLPTPYILWTGAIDPPIFSGCYDWSENRLYFSGLSVVVFCIDDARRNQFSNNFATLPSGYYCLVDFGYFDDLSGFCAELMFIKLLSGSPENNWSAVFPLTADPWKFRAGCQRLCDIDYGSVTLSVPP